MFDDMRKEDEEQEQDDSQQYQQREMNKFAKAFKMLRARIWSMIEKPYSTPYAQVRSHQCTVY